MRSCTAGPVVAVSADRELIGYTDPWSAAPGETLSVMVSTTAREYEAAVVRLRHGDDRPGAPGLRETDVAAVPTTRHTGRRQFARPGSFGWVGHPTPLRHVTRLTVVSWIWPTTCGVRRRQGVLSCLASDGTRGWALLVDEDGQAAASVGGRGGPTHVSSGVRLDDRRWHLLVATFDALCGRLSVLQLPRSGADSIGEEAVGTARVDGACLEPGPAGLLLAALTAVSNAGGTLTASGFLNGKLEDPLVTTGVWSVARARDHAEDRRDVDAVPDKVAAAWDLGGEPASSTVRDRGPHGLHAELVNLPTRAVTGHRWSGRYTDFRSRPAEYGAVHFHDDDVSDAGWEADLDIALPDDLTSGVYAVRLRGGGAQDRIPFFVRPRRGGPTADVALLLPTLTYLAYGNSRVQFDSDFARSGIVAQPHGTDPRDRWLRGRPDLGASLYDRHSDGSGCCHASRRRPLVGLRPDHCNWMTGAPRHLGADLYIVDWLEHLHVPYDVLCDEDVHEGGEELLAPYRVVITGTHPEYVTEPLLDALHAFLDGSGSLMYLGGNGFYWPASVGPAELSHCIEVRRGHAGTRPWTSEPGEAHHAFTGEPGGLWEHRGRPAAHLVGVRFAGQGWTRHGRGYTATAAALDGAADWLTAGLDLTRPIGDHGLCLGSAAGDEIDQYDVAAGSPPHATVVASCVPPPGAFAAPLERSPTGSTGTDGQADVVVFRTRGGGRVLAVSSISWAGALSYGHYDNAVARLSENALRAFLVGGPR